MVEAGQDRGPLGRIGGQQSFESGVRAGQVVQACAEQELAIGSADGRRCEVEERQVPRKQGVFWTVEPAGQPRLEGVCFVGVGRP